MNTYWKIDSTNSKGSFNIRHLMVERVYGCFEKISGTLTLDKENPNNSSVIATIEVDSINTYNEERDEHVKSVDFLDAEHFPLITFVSTNISANTISGDLTIHGITKNIILDIEGPSDEFKDRFGIAQIGFTAATELKLKDFGLTWNFPLHSGGLMIGDNVKITLDIIFIKNNL